MDGFVINNIALRHYRSVASTNRTALELDRFSHLLTVLADTQSGGRGRLGRSFYSYDGGLYMSVLLDPARVSLPCRLITPAAALAVKSVLNRYGVDRLSVKWVNDILRDGKKVCGILTEARSLGGELERIVVGIGVNLAAHDSLPEDIRHRAASLGVTLDRISLAADIAAELGERLTHGCEAIAEEYSRSLAFIGEEIELTDYADGGKKLHGTPLGVDGDCFLRIRLPDGTVRVLSSGEINSV